MSGRLFKVAGAGIAGIGVGAVLSVAGVVGLVFFILWLSQDSPATHARKKAQSFFDGGHNRTATVRICTQIGSDEEARIYRCRIAAPNCVRTHRFAVYRESVYGAAPYSVSADVGDHPCRYPSD
jgi:hypothetical protein